MLKALAVFSFLIFWIIVGIIGLFWMLYNNKRREKEEEEEETAKSAPTP